MHNSNTYIHEYVCIYKTYIQKESARERGKGGERERGKEGERERDVCARGDNETNESNKPCGLFLGMDRFIDRTLINSNTDSRQAPSLFRRLRGSSRLLRVILNFDYSPRS